MTAFRFLIEALQLVLSMAMWLIIGRIVLRILIGGSQNNAVMRVFEIATDPVYRIARKLKPNFIDDMATPIVALVLIVIARILLQAIFLAPVFVDALSK
jgi:uncharacterized protein YggT (Ycf19 family)